MIDFYDIDLNTRRLCSQSVLKDEKSMETLCSHYESLDKDEMSKFLELSERFLGFVRLGRKKYKITKNAISIAKRLKQELGISCYPYIDKIATKGWDTKGGTFSWGMILLNGVVEKEVYSFEPARLYLQKNTKLDIGPYRGFAGVLGIERLNIV